MRTQFLTAAIAALALSGCVVGEPAPYYGGSAPYYGTTYAPAYVGVNYVGGGYYPHYQYHAIHSGYNNGYWHNQRAAAHGPAGGFHGGAPAHGGTPHAAEAHSGGGHEGGEGHH